MFYQQLYIRGTYTSNGSVIAVDDFMVKKDFECPRVLDGSVVGEPLELSTPAPIELWSCNFSTGKCGLNITGNGNWYLYVNTNTTQHNDGILICFTSFIITSMRKSLLNLNEICL